MTRPPPPDPSADGLPADSRITSRVETDGAMVIMIPPPRPWEGRRRPFSVAAAFLGFLGVALLVQGTTDDRAALRLAGAAALAVATGCLLAARMGAGGGRVELRITRDAIERIETVGTSRANRRWERAEIRSIDADGRALRLLTTAGDAVTLFAGHDPREVRWIAQALLRGTGGGGGTAPQKPFRNIAR